MYKELKIKDIKRNLNLNLNLNHKNVIVVYLRQNTGWHLPLTPCMLSSAANQRILRYGITSSGPTGFVPVFVSQWMFFNIVISWIVMWVTGNADLILWLVNSHRINFKVRWENN